MSTTLQRKHKKVKLDKISTKPKKAPSQRPVGDWVLTSENMALAAQPADFTFQKMKELTTLHPENARMNRLGILARGPKQGLLSRSLWLNHNRLTSLKNLHDLVHGALEYPHLLGFLDLSNNELTEIHSDLFRFPNITVLYLHANKLSDPKHIFALRKLPRLQHLTIYANPWCQRVDLGKMRQLVAAYLPKLNKLDHNRFTDLERSSPLAANAQKILLELSGAPEDWLFRKFPIPKLTPEIEQYCKQTNPQAVRNSNYDEPSEKNDICDN